VKIMTTVTVTTHNVSFFRPGGMFTVGLIAGLIGGFAVLLVVA